jgi:hypothetical protein
MGQLLKYGNEIKPLDIKKVIEHCQKTYKSKNADSIEFGKFIKMYLKEVHSVMVRKRCNVNIGGNLKFEIVGGFAKTKKNKKPIVEKNIENNL